MRRTEDLRQQVTALERLYGDYSDGRWGWLLEDIIPLELPVPCKGALGLWKVPEDIVFSPTCKLLPVASFLPKAPPKARNILAVSAGPELIQFTIPFDPSARKVDE